MNEYEIRIKTPKTLSQEEIDRLCVQFTQVLHTFLDRKEQAERNDKEFLEAVDQIVPRLLLSMNDMEFLKAIKVSA